MKFEEFFISLIQFNRLNHSDLAEFLVEYCNLCNKDFTPEHIGALCQLVQFGQIDLFYAIRRYCELKNIVIYIITDISNNKIIKIYCKNEEHN